ncbi:MAG: CRISPR-associated protein Cas4 [Synoicihabitans sp.]
MRQAVDPTRPHVETLSISALNDHLYCERRAHLKFVDGLRGTNEHTLIGDLAHKAVDTPGYEQRAGWELLRALPLFSDTLGLSGIADLVKVRRDTATRRIIEARPVEYKKGPARRWINDHAQLCAQALCLEEMLGITVPQGLVYHVASAKRTAVVFDASLRNLVLSTLDALRVNLAQPQAPTAVLKLQCDGCSLHEICLPEASERPVSADLFLPRSYS